MNEEKEQQFTLDQIIEQSFDFTGASDEEKERIIAETSSMIMETALLRALEESDEETQDEFNTFLEGEPDEEAMSQFISEHFPHFSQFVLEEIEEFQKGDEEE